MATRAETSDELAFVDGLGQAELVRAGEVTPVELVEAAVGRIERLDTQLNAVVIEMFEMALDAARDTAPQGPFTGVPYLLKDLAVEYAGVRFTEGSRFLRHNVSTHDQELVRRLRGAGLIVVGKTNTPEFGLWPTCENDLFGATRNPWDTSRTPGGSSGGSAAAVAAGMVAMGYGNDAGGSIRYPASCCGLFGLKPTRGRLPWGPEYGDVMSGFAVEHALTRSVRDSAALLDATAGPGLGDPYVAPQPARPFVDEVRTDPGSLRVALCTTPPAGGSVHPDCVAAVQDAARLCESLGHHVVEADFNHVLERPHLAEAFEAWEGGAVAWIVSYWIRKLGREPTEDELEPLTRAWWEAGRSVTADRYLLAVQELQRASRDVARFLCDHDVWLTPTLSQPPVAVGALRGDDIAEVGGKVAAFLGFPASVANFTGNPAMSVPLYWNSEGLPIGVHFLGRFGDEATLLRIASQLEQARPWTQRRPPVSA